MTQAFGVNDRDEVVGAYTVGTGSSAVMHGFTWRPGHGFAAARLTSFFSPSRGALPGVPRLFRARRWAGRGYHGPFGRRLILIIPL
jgi:hypothetical protein